MFYNSLSKVTFTARISIRNYNNISS